MMALWELSWPVYATPHFHLFFMENCLFIYAFLMHAMLFFSGTRLPGKSRNDENLKDVSDGLYRPNADETFEKCAPNKVIKRNKQTKRVVRVERG
jgi:hypothetical protein